MSISVKRLTDDEIKLHILDLARLRIEVFKEFPYIYDGSVNYEVKYLKKYLKSKRAALIGAFDQDKVIGISSCLPLADEENHVQKTFIDTGLISKKYFILAKVFYKKHIEVKA